MAIRTATPFSTCSRMTLRGPSATSDESSTPRLMGPGWRMAQVGVSHSAAFLALSPQNFEYSRVPGMSGSADALVLDAEHDDRVSAFHRLPQLVVHGGADRLDAGGIIVGGPQKRTFAPSLVSPYRSERATREWLMSPTIAMVFPAMVREVRDDGPSALRRLAAHAAEVLGEREEIEQALARVLVSAVACR